MKLFHSVRTPCIGVCSTGIGDSVCRGCKRFDHEVIRWNSYTHDQKLAIDLRLDELLTRVVSWRLKIVDEALLQAQMQMQQIQYEKSRNPYCWLFELLRAGAGQIEDATEYGFTKIALFEHQTLSEIRHDIDDEFYSLSVAHYERYIVANRKRANRVSSEP
ncbi:MAG: DUF1289 domain-containing protein [Pseudomonadales bacterium]